MPLPTEIVRVRTIGEHDGAYWLAWSADGDSVVLEQGESVLAEADVDVTLLKPKPISLGMMHVAFTDRRVTMLTREFGPGGGGYSGFGAVGLSVALVANTVSKHNAKKARAGKVAVGHVRYEWLGVVEYRRLRTAHGAGMILYLLSEAGPAVLHLNSRGWPVPEMCRWVAQRAAFDRLQLGRGLDATDHATLTQLLHGSDAPLDVSERHAWSLPGDIETLINASYETRFAASS